MGKTRYAANLAGLLRYASLPIGRAKTPRKTRPRPSRAFRGKGEVRLKFRVAWLLVCGGVQGSLDGGFNLWGSIFIFILILILILCLERKRWRWVRILVIPPSALTSPLALYVF
jgi:hypothetical protein